MKKAGFTLIELISVIVILAIIALIATPIILNIINDAKYKSQKQSIDNYAQAIKNAVAKENIKEPNKHIYGKFLYEDYGKKIKNIKNELNINYDGNKVICDIIIINKDGTIYLSECSVDGNKVYINKDESKKENPTMYYEYGKTEYGMIMENKSHSNKFLNTGIDGYKISQFKISNTLDIPNKETYQSVDCSYNQDCSVICYYKELEDKPNYYVVYLASDGEMYTPVNSSYLFYNLGYQRQEFKLNLTGLNTSKTKNMSYMFKETGSSNEINLGDKFNTSNVTNMEGMFYNFFTSFKGSFKLPDSFNTSNVTNMHKMFHMGFYSASLLDLGNSFDTSNVTDMSYMFESSFYLRRLNLGNKFDTSNVTNMSHMFNYLGEKVMTSLSLGNKFDTSKVTNMASMFAWTGSSYMTNLDLGNKFDTSKVENMSNMFQDCRALKNLNLGDKFDTTKVTNMSYMFAGLNNLTTLDLGDKFDTSNVTNMNHMFNYFGKDIENFSLGDKFDTSNVIDMGGMFNGAFKNKLKKLDLGDKFYTSKVKSMSSMFEETGYENMEELDLGDKFDTSNVSRMSKMFYRTGYNKLKKLDLGKEFVVGTSIKWYDLRYDNMFEETGKESMEELYLWNFDRYTRTANYYRENMFINCGTEGILTKVVVSTDSFKNTLRNDSTVPNFWKKDGEQDIIVVQAP